jgi:hypothetical protein
LFRLFRKCTVNVIFRPLLILGEITSTVLRIYFRGREAINRDRLMNLRVSLYSI